MTDPKEIVEEDFQEEVQEVDSREDMENDSDYFNELENNFNNAWK